MATAGLVVRLAVRNLRARPGQALLLLVALCLATTTLSMALAVDQTGNAAWQRVWQRTNGIDVVAFAGYLSDRVPPGADLAWARRELAGLAHQHGVVATDGPAPELAATARIGGGSVPLDLSVRGPHPVVDRPAVVAGRWLGIAPGVVLEDGAASVLHVRPGDAITVAGVALPVVGTATAISGFHGYPVQETVRAWVSPAGAALLNAAGVPDYDEALRVKLADPADAPAFAAAHALPDVPAPRFTETDTWESMLAHGHDDLTTLGVALLVVGALLAGLTLATAGVLVAGRLAARTRQVGTLKAVGVTPWQLTGVLLTEYLILAVVAAAVGLTAGTLLSPLLATSERTLYGAPQAPPVTAGRAAIVVGVVVAVVVLATVRPALRAARHSTLRSLGADVRAPRRSSRLARLATAARLPLPAVLGLRGAARRPGRLLLHATGLALALATVVVGLTVEDSWRRRRAGLLTAGADATRRAAQQSLLHQVLVIVAVGAAVLLGIALVNTIVVALFAARENARSQATLRAVGATPRQTLTALVVEQLCALLIACAVGIPLGIALFDEFAAGLGGGLSPLAYLAVVGVAVVLYAVFVAVPARVVARQPVAPLLRSE